MPHLPLKVGSDPEFVIVANGLKLATSRVFAAHLKNWNGDKLEIGNHGNLGKDHNDIAEIRPTPENDPLEHVKHIKELLETCHKAMPIAELKTISLWAPIGGHVHLETPQGFIDRSERARAIIHQAMMSFSLPLFIGENHINAKIRTQGGTYGKIEDVRVERKNSVYTWEFRPLTAEWLTTPETAAATLAYLGVIWNEFVNKPEKIKEYKNIIVRNVDQARAFQTIAIDDFTTLLTPLIREIKKHVQTFEYYETYKEQCDLALNPKEMLALKEKSNWNIVEGWNFSKEAGKIPSKRNLNNDKKTKQRMSKMNLDLMKTYQQIFWTNDRNIEKIARGIGDRAIAWNWNLTNRYFFFALPKEATEPVIVNGENKWLQGHKMAKTQRDAEILTQLTEKAMTSFRGTPAFEMKSVNLKNGKAEKDTSHSILIGVPYKNRESGEYKKILDFIHDLETNKIESKIESLKDFTLPETDTEHGEGLLVPKTVENQAAILQQQADIIARGEPVPMETTNIINRERANDIDNGTVDPTPMYLAEEEILNEETEETPQNEEPEEETAEVNTDTIETETETEALAALTTTA